jgi:outer membrane protein OmpA-like peptidoglycan-associated protein
MKINKRLTSLLLLLSYNSIFTSLAVSQTPIRLRVVVNSNQDGVQADSGLTLREAIELTNGTLSVDRLSESEKSQVSVINESVSQISFQLPTGQTIIRVGRELPAIVAPVTLDGTTQTGYEPDKAVIAELPLVKPIVEITPTQNTFVPRGLTITSDNVTIRGLSLYGFNDDLDDTARTPPADIFIAHRLPPPDIRKQPTPANFSPFYSDDVPPKNVVIENNWLGIRPDQSVPPTTSAFGVSVFNSTGTTIRRNWIANHDGSGIITSVNSTNLQVTENAIVANGLAGMPDAIRLEGNIDQSEISGNLICGNDGSGVYLFKPEGATQIRDNRITYNGRRFRRAAVYLMGNNHQVTGNLITHQAGSGVVVAAFPLSRRNTIANNRFSNLEGLSIDLVTQGNVSVQAYQKGDGINPARNSPNRRKDTGNGAIDSPQFTAKEFILTGTQAQLTGKADPNSQIQLYRVTQNTSPYGLLSEPLGNTQTDKQGNFTFTSETLKPGDLISAIATDPNYGTSEPALNTIVRTAETATPPNVQPPTRSVPTCVTPPIAQVPTPPTPEPNVPIRLTVPKNVHFALDKFYISPESARVLDRIATVVLANPTIILELQGHTDPRASDAYNQKLGERRALSVRNYLIRKGINPARMTLRSFGERQRISDGNTRLDFARDRRVEVIYKDARDLEVFVQEEDLQLEPARGGR